MTEEKSPLAELLGSPDARPVHRAHAVLRQGVEIEIPMWVLTQDEEHQAKKRANDYLDKELQINELDLHRDDQQTLHEARAVEVLSIALRNPKNVLMSFARNASEIRAHLGSVVITTLANEYSTYKREEAWLQNLEDPIGELNKLVDHMGKGIPVNALLMRYDSISLRVLLRLAVDQLASAAKPS